MDDFGECAMGVKKPSEPITLYITKRQRRLDVPRCENLGCSMATDEERKSPKFLGVVIEPPLTQHGIAWKHGKKHFDREIFLCMECRQQLGDAKTVSVAVVS